MHRLLKRQLKKIGYKDNTLTKEQFKKLILFIDAAYRDNDSDRVLLENALSTSSVEMQGLYKQLKEQSENDLAKSEARYYRLIDNLQNHYFFYSHDLEGTITYISKSITNILGYSIEEALKHYSTYLTNDSMNSMVDEYTRRALSGEILPPFEISIYHKDGSKRYFEIIEHPYYDANSEIEGVEGIARDITSQYESRNKIYHLANHDLLTGIPNRLYLEEKLKGLISQSKRNNKHFAMLFLDLDHFKQINDTLGHDIGDKLLKEVVERIQKNIREEDILARIGGDEFIIVLTDIDKGDITSSINKIMELMHHPWSFDGYELNVSSSVGISLYPEDGNTAIDLMKSADIAMYRAKALGRDNFCFFTPDLDRHIHFEMKLEQEMKSALENNQFELYYQPKVRLDDNKVFSAEALIRWNHPQMGLIYPEYFITLAENTGFMLKLGRWIIEEACHAISRFNKITSEKLTLSVNVSMRQFQQGNLCDTFQAAIEKYKIDPEQFAIEITESIMLENRRLTLEKLNKMKSMGVKICIDDFGTGYSSLSYLHHLPIDAIKVDKIFVDEIKEESGEQPIILNTIIAMGKMLDMFVLAEGVEHEYQRKYLQEHGCDFYQGYLFSKPLNESEFSLLISDN